MPQYSGNAVINLILKLIFRHTETLLLLLFFLFSLQILAADNLFGRGFCKRNFSYPAAQNALERRQFLIVFFDNLSHRALNIGNICSFRIFKIRVYLRTDRIVLAVHQNILDQTLILKEIFQLLRCHILTVA